jgi:hypothetical protein
MLDELGAFMTTLSWFFQPLAAKLRHTFINVYKTAQNKILGTVLNEISNTLRFSLV